MVKYAELTPEEATNIQKDLTDLMEKYNCDMQVTSQIQILKRIEDDGETADTEATEAQSTGEEVRP